MTRVSKVTASSTTYDLDVKGGDSSDSTTATSWTSVDTATTGEMYSTSFFPKITKMFKNIRFLYNQLGTTDISGISTTVTGAISSLNSNKAASSHSHTVSTLPVSSQQVNSSSKIPTSDLIYSMNSTLNGKITPIAGTRTQNTNASGNIETGILVSDYIIISAWTGTYYQVIPFSYVDTGGLGEFVWWFKITINDSSNTNIRAVQNTSVTVNFIYYKR